MSTNQGPDVARELRYIAAAIAGPHSAQLNGIARKLDSMHVTAIDDMRELHKTINELMDQRAKSDAVIALAATKVAFELATALEEFKRGQTGMMTAQEVLLFSAVRVAFDGLRAIVDGLQPDAAPVGGNVH